MVSPEYQLLLFLKSQPTQPADLKIILFSFFIWYQLFVDWIGIRRRRRRRRTSTMVMCKLVTGGAACAVFFRQSLWCSSQHSYWPFFQDVGRFFHVQFLFYISNFFILNFITNAPNGIYFSGFRLIHEQERLKEIPYPSP